MHKWVLFFCLYVASAYAQTPPGAAGMHLRFNETFQEPLSWCSEQCTTERWRTKYYHSDGTPLSRGLGMSGPEGHPESEIYMDPNYLGLGINPFQIDHGVLTIEAEPASQHVKDAVQAAWPPWYKGKHIAPRFTSGALTTEKSFSQLYGYFEARIKVSDVVGAWPAFWLYDCTHDSGDEIDIMEVLGGQPTRLYMSVHRVVNGVRMPKGVTLNTVDLSADFHTYGVRWTADEIVFYLDDVEVGRLPNPGLHRPLQIMLDLAMDGDWNKKEGFVAAPDAHATMKVQYVKAYQ